MSLQGCFALLFKRADQRDLVMLITADSHLLSCSRIKLLVFSVQVLVRVAPWGMQMLRISSVTATGQASGDGAPFMSRQSCDIHCVTFSIYTGIESREEKRAVGQTEMLSFTGHSRTRGRTSDRSQDGRTKPNVGLRSSRELGGKAGEKKRSHDRFDKYLPTSLSFQMTGNSLQSSSLAVQAGLCPPYLLVSGGDVRLGKADTFVEDVISSIVGGLITV